MTANAARAPYRICVLGAESTGKTALCAELAQSLAARGLSVAVVPEVLREWCERERRTPRVNEQLAIAAEQTARVDAARADVVISDTGALMVAVYSDMLFGDRSLHAMALAHLRGFDLVLLTGLDIPWVADGLQRDGPQVREPVDARVRAALAEGGIAWQVVYGVGPARRAAALRAIDAALRTPGATTVPTDAQAAPAAAWVCDKCSDPQCEHRLFRRLEAGL